MTPVAADPDLRHRIGSALTAPAWSAIIPELVPREDLVGAIT